MVDFVIEYDHIMPAVFIEYAYIMVNVWLSTSTLWLYHWFYAFDLRNALRTEAEYEHIVFLV